MFMQETLSIPDNDGEFCWEVDVEQGLWRNVSFFLLMFNLLSFFFLFMLKSTRLNYSSFDIWLTQFAYIRGYPQCGKTLLEKNPQKNMLM